MASKLYVHLGRYQWNNDELAHHYGRYERCYGHRKSWKVQTKAVMYNLRVTVPEKRHVRYYDIEVRWAELRRAREFYLRRKPWKRLSNYTAARIRDEWNEG